MNINYVFQVPTQASDIQQNLVSNVQNLSLSEDKTPLISDPQTTAETPQSTLPPPFLSGVPMVNPGTFPPNNLPPISQQHLTQQPDLPQPFSTQTQSVVSNMAAYSSSKLLYLA